MAEFSQIDNSHQVVAGYRPDELGYDLQLTHPDNILGGTLRGTQNVGTQGVQIDAAHNRISLGTPVVSGLRSAAAVLGRLSDDTTNQSFGLRISDTNGTTMVIGVQADGTMGIQITDADGFLLFKLTGTQWDWYDKNYNTNTLRVGKLPDGNYGWVAVPPSKNVSDAITGA